MAEKTPNDHFTEAILLAIDETFERVVGLYLDKGTSIFETLATISAEDASQPVSANCASIAAHVEHMTFYIETLLKRLNGDASQVAWTIIWNTVEAVSAEEWQASQNRLRNAYQRMRTLASTWSWVNAEDMGGAIAMLMHNAYHLGEIRQALCTIQS